MESIVFIQGNVKFPITLDPGVWIFDDRKVEIETYFNSDTKVENELEEYTIAASKHWEKEIREGATMPPTLKTERKFEKQRLLEGTFVIPFKPFLDNAEPNSNATEVVVKTANSEQTFTKEDAETFVIGFSINGKPIKEHGPMYIYFGDGSNIQNPIKDVRAFIIR
ncbi:MULTISPECIES: hypothetical protein [Bacillaceae]|uniref:Peptidyl-prolyl cis-trans isomerase n=1 Tax=Peribacillus huizhouensis TaxID=1501239 RepID=A0ABR6CIX9_9BACI|nr:MULTISPECIES: hypothetical protein [Bacillaceae]MBA9025004.1 hypothetical protein [Peribacillus huizhouensis]